MLKLKSKVTLPAAGLSGFETPLSEEETAVQAGVHRFAKDVLRPLGARLDKMSAEDVIAPGSPYYSVFAEYAKLGLDPAMLAEGRLARLILEHSHSGMVVCDVHGRITLASSAIQQMCGENPVLKPFDSVLPLHVVGEYAPPVFSINEVLRGGSHRSDHLRGRHFRPGGTFNPLLVAGGQHLHMRAADIDDQDSHAMGLQVCPSRASNASAAQKL